LSKGKLLILIGSICLIIALATLPFLAGCAKSAPAPAPTPTPMPTPTPAPSPAPPEVIKWTMQSAYAEMDVPAPLLPELIMTQKWVEWVKGMSGGRLVIDLVPPGTVCPPMESFGAVKEGLLDACFTYAGFDKGALGTITDIAIGLPGMWPTAIAIRDAMEYYGIADVIRKAYAEHGIYYLYTCPGGFYNIYTTFPIDSVDDIKGKKIRAVGGYGKLIEKLGGSPTVVAGPDMYMALKTGTIDGCIYGGESTYGLKFYEVLTHMIVEPKSLCAFNMVLYINNDVLEALPDDIKFQLKNYSDDVLTAYGIDKSAACCKAMAMTHNEGVEFVYLSPEETGKLWAACEEVWADVKAEAQEKGEKYTLEALELLEKQRADHDGIWWGLVQ